MSADNKAVNLSAVLKSHAAYIRGEGGERADLSGANLRWANLSGADLTDAILIDAILIDAILTDANLSGADLTGANLRLADAPAETAVADAWQRHWDDRAAAEKAKGDVRDVVKDVEDTLIAILNATGQSVRQSELAGYVKGLCSIRADDDKPRMYATGTYKSIRDERDDLKQQLQAAKDRHCRTTDLAVEESMELTRRAEKAEASGDAKLRELRLWGFDQDQPDMRLSWPDVVEEIYRLLAKPPTGDGGAV